MKTWTKGHRRRPLGVAGVLAAVALVCAACSSSPSSTGTSSTTGSSTTSGTSSTSGTVTVDVGLTTPISLKPPMKIAIFTSAGGAAFGAAEDAQMKTFASKHNLTLTIFTSAFKSTLQYNQIQTAIQDKKFNVLGVLPVTGQNICKELSVDAPKANLLVTDFDQPLCGRFTEEGTTLWQPGTLNYISGYDTKTTLRAWITAIIKANPGKQTVGLVEGFAADGLSTNINTLVQAAAKTDPTFHVVATEHTTYTSAKGYTVTQGLLQAHPNLSVVIADQSTITAGVARAIAQAGKSKTIYVADWGGDKAVVTLMKQGQVNMTAPTYPATEGKIVLQQLLKAAAGTTVKRLISLPFKAVTPTNVTTYTPEY